MAENPTSSSTIYTTFDAPSGAFGGSNGAQSGTESRISTLTVPLNCSLTSPLLCQKTCHWFRLGRPPGREPPQRRPHGPPAAPGGCCPPGHALHAQERDVTITLSSSAPTARPIIRQRPIPPCITHQG